MRHFLGIYAMLGSDLKEEDRESLFVAEDYARLVARCGKRAVILTPDGAAHATVTAIVKMGVLGRNSKVVPVAEARRLLGAGTFTHDFVLVCASPLDAATTLVLSETAAAEELLVATKLRVVRALAAAGGLTPAAAWAHCREVVCYLAAGIVEFRARARFVETPTGTWNIYESRSGNVPPPDRLTAAIKGFASCSARVHPPLPPFDRAELDLVLQLHDLFVAAGAPVSAHELIRVALSAPQFAGAIRCPELFARAPPLALAWGDFGGSLLRYLFSAELTRAAYRATTGPLVPVTAADPYVTTLDALIAMGVRHAPASPAAAAERLDAYVGGYLAELDLSVSLITGSAIAASAIVTDVEMKFALAHYVLYCEARSGRQCKLDFSWDYINARHSDDADMYADRAYDRCRPRPAKCFPKMTSASDGETAPASVSASSDGEGASDSEADDNKTPPAENEEPTSDDNKMAPPAGEGPPLLRFREWLAIPANRLRAHAAYLAAHYPATRTTIRASKHARVTYAALIKAAVSGRASIRLQPDMDPDGRVVLVMRGVITPKEKETRSRPRKGKARTARARSPSLARARSPSPDFAESSLPARASSPSPVIRPRRASSSDSSVSDSNSPSPTRVAAASPERSFNDITGEAAVALDVTSGADLDIAVDVETNDEFDDVAKSHYDVIRRHFPGARLEKVLRGSPGDPRHNWAIMADSPEFRQVEIYRANFNHVVSHHVGMVSGAYTAKLSECGAPPAFYVSARFGLAMDNLATPNYYYFASRKVGPQHVVMKYANRGFGFDAFPEGIQRALCATFALDPTWHNPDCGKWHLRNVHQWNITTEVHVFPAAAGLGYFSAYSLPLELECLRVFERR
jgi:hypothetical protein